VVWVALPEEVSVLHEMTVSEIGPSVASLETMQQLYKHNPEALEKLEKLDAAIFQAILDGLPPPDFRTIN